MIKKLIYKDYSNLSDQVEAMEREGYVIFKNLLNNNEIKELKDATDRLDIIPESYDSINKHGNPSKLINNAFNRDILFLKYLDKPRLINLAEAVHGDTCHIIQMHLWKVGKRESQDLHDDWTPFSLPQDLRSDQRLRLPIFITTAHIYLDDVNEELGPTKIIPGSHLYGQSIKEYKSKTVENKNALSNHEKIKVSKNLEQSFIGRAGDCIYFRSEIWHKGAANISNKVRYSFMIHYANEWINQKFPPYLNFKFNNHIVENATNRQRRILGEHPTGPYT